MFPESRYTDSTPVLCDDCKWRGTIADCIHTYRGIAPGKDVEPVSLCPYCMSENLIEVLPDSAELELVPA